MAYKTPQEIIQMMGIVQKPWTVPSKPRRELEEGR